MKKTIALLTVMLFAGVKTFACDVCEQNQPAVFKGITHGPGPSGSVDYFITVVAVVTVGICLFLAIKYLIKPRETNADHIKNIVLNEN